MVPWLQKNNVRQTRADLVEVFLGYITVAFYDWTKVHSL